MLLQLSGALMAGGTGISLDSAAAPVTATLDAKMPVREKCCGQRGGRGEIRDAGAGSSYEKLH